MNIIFAGDSWALKGFTFENFDKGNDNPLPGDERMADHWPWSYLLCIAPGQGNLTVMDRIIQANRPELPVIWIWTEPGRDQMRVTGKDPFAWMKSENIWQVRHSLADITMGMIRRTLPNPIGLIGGLSDIEIDLAKKHGFDVIHPSWQKWIANTLHSKWFKFGWGASDIGWRSVYHDVTPSKTATFAWDEQIKEWCWWQDQGYFCHEHPSLIANVEFAQYLLPNITEWIDSHGR